MRFLLLVLVVFWIPRLSLAESSLYVGPMYGATSFSNVNSDASRDTQTAYGGEILYGLDHWLGGFSYSAYSVAQSGTAAINVSQDNKDVEAEIKYKLLNDSFTPFISVGAGELFQKITTQLYTESETNQGQYFIRDVGAGVLARFLNNFGVSLSLSYYQYSNINGFKYFISLGYFPLL